MAKDTLSSLRHKIAEQEIDLQNLTMLFTSVMQKQAKVVRGGRALGGQYLLVIRPSRRIPESFDDATVAVVYEDDDKDLSPFYYATGWEVRTWIRERCSTATPEEANVLNDLIYKGIETVAKHG